MSRVAPETGAGELDAVLSEVIPFSVALAKLGNKEKQSVERHLVARETDPDGIRVWQRLVSVMMHLSGLPPKATGQHTMQFFVPDGKYKMQVFALQDQRDGKLTLYIPDELDEALELGVLSWPQAGVEGYPVPGEPRSLMIHRLDGHTESNPLPFYKDMLGWNRKALRITLPPTMTDGQVRAVERLLALAARRWKQTSAA